MKRQNCFIILLVLYCLPFTGIYAQVTIGSGLAPNKGSILDLKEYKSVDSNKTTATKGLMLPRVELTDFTNLYPMFLEDNDYKENNAGKKDSEDALHTGLTVYNISKDYCKEVYPGVYVWNGQEWILVGEYPFPAEVDMLVDDRDPANVQKYRIGKFGDAGWWMLENLRATTWPKNSTEGVDVGDLVLEKPVTVSIDPVYKPTYYYPKEDPADLAANPHHGYMYSLHAALRITHANFLDNTFELSGRQGICPDGWRLPTWDDWRKLAFSKEKNSTIVDGEVYLNPCKYAHSDINVNTGVNMISMEDSPKGKSRIPDHGGFNGNLLGRITSDRGSIEVGSLAYFWLGHRDTTLGNPFTGALAEYLNFAAYYQPMASRTQISVRCVRND
ncbi:hypothetical protein JGH11_13990 [Dysgonomonas sp. Marseille-P4677]|uniref:FISUMP domain-containing protein n=1 Tax=Dysgonomonas sp. Marseille-P4677 TaxID=2364790 RepID=UPI001913A1B8|nr:FISUMP domain-containing protein [Dysgonomonas sp. Marseille-P4677]MBK5721985.1 hypothetical protein [Dysgonomonas sp. Marseille-P4677]